MAIKSFNGFIKGSDTYKCRDDRANNLGTASAKNSTSVVTDSTDLVESGAVKDIVGWGNKNLCPIKFNTNLSFHGLSITNNKDGTITVNGTKSDSGYSAYSVTDEPFYLDAGTYIISGVTSNEATEKIIFAISNVDTGNQILPTQTATTVLTLDSRTKVTCRLGFRAGASADNITFKPMIERGSEATEFEPYHASVADSLAEKCDNSVIAPVENGATASQAYSVGRGFMHNGQFRVAKSDGVASGATINDNNSVVKTIESLIPIRGKVTIRLDDVTWVQSVGGAYYVTFNDIANNAEMLSVSYGSFTLSETDVGIIPFIKSNGKGYGLLAGTNTFTANKTIEIVYTYRLI